MLARMKQILFQPNYTQVLGRWNYVDSEKALNRKIDMANVDNCGPCLYNKDMPMRSSQTKNNHLKINIYQETSIDLIYFMNNK